MRFLLPKTLFGRLLLVFLGFGVMMTLALLIVMQGTHRLYHLEADQSINRGLAQTYYKSNFLLGEMPLTGATLHKGLARLAAANPDVDIYLVDGVGAIVAASVPEREWQRRAITLDPLRSMLRGDGLPILGDDPRGRGRREIFSAAPISILACPARYLYIVLHRSENDAGAMRLRAEYALGEGVGVLLLAAILAVSLSIFVVRLLTRRLASLDDAMRQFETAHGGAMPRSSIDGIDTGDEIDRLTAIFRRLAAQVEEHVRALQSTDSMRRDVLANVSHDLRTPLSTLRAHLEALDLKSSTLSMAEQCDYLAIALRQTQRLSRLVEQLIEAAKLDAAQVTMRAEPFSLADLAQDVVQKFALAAQEHEVHFDLQVPQRLPWVLADVALIERVLDNLIENALRHSPRGGRVGIALTAGDGRIAVQVTDAGPGLMPDQVARIFERFYRADPSRSGETGHAGLGLSIVKSILELHGTTISVEGRPGLGARFYFSLPVATDSGVNAQSDLRV